MRTRLMFALAFLALAACDRPTDPAAQARETCADTDAAAQDRVDACTIVIEASGEDEAARAEALAARGAAHQEAGAVTPALRDFEAALRLNEDSAVALEGRAAILLASGQLDAAEPLIARLIAAGGANAHVHTMKGDIAALRGEADSAINAYDAAIAADRNYAPALAGRASAREQTGDLDAARRDYNAAIAADGTLAQARAGRCWLNLTQDREIDQARNDAEAAVAADPQMVRAQLCRGILQLRGEEWANARTSFDAALAIEPGNPTALFGRGVARRRSGDGEGRRDMNQARDFERNIGARFDQMGVDTY